MTTIAVVRKGRYAAIAADTLTKWGSGKESAQYVANNDKVVKVGSTYLAASGSATFKTIMRDYFGRPRTPARSHTGSSSGAGGNTAFSPISKVTAATSRVPRKVIACCTLCTRPAMP